MTMNDLLYIPSLKMGDRWTAGVWISLSNITHILDYTDKHWAHEPTVVCHFTDGKTLKVHGPAALMVKNYLNSLADQDDQDIPC
ncbi:hypothetical protein [Spirulina sp. CCNP1310]|uniref:hypothetical protein n=1 Tax=Spirulina sp. CCNP1310 TaxID=3110249 RepID=UPI002B1EA830|nr:hypothetical protein [Spirulina sp. CCNP1310]